MADTSPSPVTGASQNWVALAAMIIVGALALFSIYQGFISYGEGDEITAILYLVIGVSGFVAIGYSFFRAKEVTPEPLQMKKSEVVTTLEYPQCNLKRVRAFKRGDYLYKNDEPCTRCEGNMVVTRIHTRAEEKKKKRS
jgi:hypothetical protein